jgi:hypothetical protein
VTGERRKLHNGELHNLYPSPDIIRVMRFMENVLSGACSTYGRDQNPYKIFVRKSEEKRLLWGPDGRWKEDIKMVNSLHIFKYCVSMGKWRYNSLDWGLR